MPKKVPWRERCSYLSPAETKRESVTPRGWTHRPTHTTKPGELLEETSAVVKELEVPALGKQIRDLNSAEWESIRLRLTRTAPTVTL